MSLSASSTVRRRDAAPGARSRSFPTLLVTGASLMLLALASGPLPAVHPVAQAAAVEQAAPSFAGVYPFRVQRSQQPFSLHLQADGTFTVAEEAAGGSEDGPYSASGTWAAVPEAPDTVRGELRVVRGQAVPQPEVFTLTFKQGLPDVVRQESSGATFDFTTLEFTLGSGDSHPFVATLNARLAELARQGAITFEGPDGDPATYGEATRRAVASFQEAHGLVSTGVLDLPTWEAMQAVQAPPSPPSAPPVAQLEVAVPDGGTPRVRTMAAGGDGQPAVYLTFDDGPHPTYTPQVLDTLARHGVVGTFFVLGQQAERYPDLVRRAASAGHYVANHTYDHHTLQGAGLQQFMHEVQGTRDILVRIAGDVFTLDHDVRYLRPPYGATDGNTRQLAAQLGYSVVLWDIDPQDWRRPGAGQISSHILSHVRPGAIVLMHDGGGDRSQTVAALDTVLSELKNRGYTFRNVFEMSRAQPPAPSPASGGGAGAGAVVSGTGGQGVNLRASPGLRAPVIKGLPEGAPLTLLGGDASGDGLTWRHVRDAQGAEGWVAAQFVSPR